MRPLVRLTQTLTLALALAANVALPTTVPPVDPADGSCGTFRPLPEPSSLAGADALSGLHPYVLRRRVRLQAGSESDCETTAALALAGDDRALLKLLGESAVVEDLAAYAEVSGLEPGTTLAAALRRQREGERLYYQTRLQLQSAAHASALRSQCVNGSLPRHLDNAEWQSCLGPAALDPLSASALSWLAVFVGVAHTGMALHRDMLITHVWAVQLAGSKRFVFCPESELSNTAIPGDQHGANIDAFNTSSWRTAPAFDPSACFHAELAPGDLVYWPSRWLHQSFHEERSIALSSFSIGKGLRDGFFETVKEYFPGLDQGLVAQMKACAHALPE